MMKQSLALNASMLTWACLAATLTAADRPIEGRLEAFLGEPRMETQQLFKDERFPNIVVTLEGTVLATWGNTSVRLRRSEDGGDTWVEPRDGAIPTIYTFMRDIDFAPGGRRGLIVGQGGRILRTDDSGYEWKQVLPVEETADSVSS
jgi:photosystem II stability/assembly factor-like uncharacterized protein